jgi:hypothetical protein
MYSALFAYRSVGETEGGFDGILGWRDGFSRMYGRTVFRVAWKGVRPIPVHFLDDVSRIRHRRSLAGKREPFSSDGFSCRFMDLPAFHDMAIVAPLPLFPNPEDEVFLTIT